MQNPHLKSLHCGVLKVGEDDYSCLVSAALAENVALKKITFLGNNVCRKY